MGLSSIIPHFTAVCKVVLSGKRYPRVGVLVAADAGADAGVDAGVVAGGVFETKLLSFYICSM